MNPPIVDPKKEYQKHHIQPLHAQKLDKDWNIVRLPVEDHAEAHRLLYESYGNYLDLCAWYMMTGKTQESLALMRKQNQLKKRHNFYLVTGLTRLLTCNQTQRFSFLLEKRRTKKRLFSIKNWRVLGIFLSCKQ